MGHTPNQAPGGLDKTPGGLQDQLAQKAGAAPLGASPAETPNTTHHVTAAVNGAAAVQPTTITIDDFAKLDIRVGRILTAERVPTSTKLIKMNVAFGETLGERTILAAIGEHPEFVLDTLIHTHGLFLVNLPPRKMMGTESRGMLLSAKGRDGQFHPATCGASPEPGSKVG